jgi:diguanylate cyclase (GGDEF)-like protein
MKDRRRMPVGDESSKQQGGKERVPAIAGEEPEEEGTNTKIRAASKAPTSSRDRPFLVVLAGSSVGEMYPLDGRETIIGRASTVQIPIEADDSISRRHAKLTMPDGHVHVEDLGSANGTQVNGVSITGKQRLNDGDKLTVGGTVLKFTFSDEMEATFQRTMLRAALRDGLTGAFNKRYLIDRLATELAFAERHQTPLSLIMLDVDHFKRINDTFGHPAGDEVLVQLVTLASATIRKEDVLARCGGEEFAVLCRSIDAGNASVLAERLRQRIAESNIHFEGERIPVTISLGVAELSVGGTAEKLVATADAALYEAKQRGRNRLVVKDTA